MDTEAWDEKQGGMNGMAKMLIALVVVASIAALWKWRHNSKPERSIDKVMHSIRSSELPERSKKSMLGALDDARDGLGTLREAAGELAKRAS
ncbi:MAG TPA: hypothetical protein VMM78_06245 [Thermomicrobiales bacterium]|nr:hypothetical protein [Thermomicrobiales bacterium]